MKVLIFLLWIDALLFGALFLTCLMYVIALIWYNQFERPYWDGLKLLIGQSNKETGR